MEAALVYINKESWNGTTRDKREQLNTVEIRQYSNKDLSRYTSTLEAECKTVHRLSLEVALLAARVVLTISNIEIVLWFAVLV